MAVEPLVAYFLARFACKLGKSIDAVPQRELQELIRYPWPGNVRELQNVIERAVVLSRGSVPELGADPFAASLAPPLPTRIARGPAESTAGAPLREVERAHILDVLAQTGWVIEGAKGAAARLELHPNTLRSRLKKLGVRRP